MSTAATSAERSRSEQGAERRAAILDATARLLVREGLAAVTHRAVAREAGVPLAATTYYFASKDELVVDALRILVQDEITRVGERAAALGEELASPSRSAAAVAEVLFPDAEAAAGLLAKFEVYLEAARRPGLRATAAHWQRAFVELAESALTLAGSADPARLAPLLVAGVDGMLVHRLSEGIDDLEVDRLRSQLEQLFELVLAAD
jgi:TetR/AcrR family transcriptional regulator, regulator of biofilm formation and stress response